MNFELNEEQQMLADTVERLVRNTYSFLLHLLFLLRNTYIFS